MHLFKILILICSISIGSIFISCNTQSKKGAWSKADKVLFYKEMENTKDLDNLGEDKTKWIDCYYEKSQKEFASFEEANNNLEGCKKLAEICAIEVIDQGSAIGKWSDRDKKMYFEEMNNTDLNQLGELKNDYVNCYLKKLENNFSSIRKANMDSTRCEELAIECASELLPVLSNQE